MSSTSQLSAALADTSVGRIVLTPGVYPLTSALTIARNVSIVAREHGTVVLDGQGGTRVFIITSSVVELTGLIVTGGHGYEGGGCRIDGSIVNINNCSIHHNQAAYGAGLWIYGGTMAITSTQIYNNTATARGGGVRIDNGFRLIMESSSILGNHGKSGAGVSISDSYFADASADQEFIGHLYFLNCDVGENVGASNGGGFLMEGGGSSTTSAPVTFVGGDIRSNSAVYSGGGLFISGSRNLTITNSQVYSNTAELLQGGGLMVAGGNLVAITSSQIYFNTANRAGGIMALGSFGGSVHATSSQFYSNKAGATGGGMVWSSNGVLRLVSVVLSSNVAGGGSGHDLKATREPADGSLFVNVSFESSIESGTYVVYSTEMPWYPCPLGRWMPDTGTVSHSNWTVCAFDCSSGSYGATGDVRTAGCSGACPSGHCKPAQVEPAICSTAATELKHCPFSSRRSLS